MRKFKIILLYIYAFLIFYNPRLEIYFPFSHQQIICFIFAINILINIKSIVNKPLDKKLILLYLGIIVSSVYYIIRASIAKNPNINTNIMAIFYLTNTIFLIKYLEKIGYKNEKAIKFLLNVALIQSLIGIAMFIFPGFRKIALDLYLTGNTRIELEWLTAYRIYGITGDYTSGTPVFHGMLGVVATVYAVWQDKSFLKYLPFLIFIIVVNGRTGLVVMVFGVIVAFGLMLINKTKVKKILKYSIVLVVIAFLSLMILSIISNRTYEWLMSGVEDTIQLIITGNKEGNYKALLGSMLYLPKGIGVIFGEGHRVFGSEARLYGYPSGSDIGLVNDMFMGGIIYVYILYMAYIQFIVNKIFKRGNNILLKINKSISISFIIILLIANFKGEFMRGSSLLSGIIFVKLIILNEINNKTNSVVV